MTRQRWQRIQEIFDRAVELEGPARAALLELACGDDAALRREVETLLSSHEESGAILRPFLVESRSR